MYKSSIVIERMDYLMMEKGGGEQVFPKSEFMAMVSEGLCTPIEQIWRVKIEDDGSVHTYSFAMPQEKNLPAARCLNTTALPDWIKERISVLQICEQGDIVDGVGQKLSNRVFYVIE
jgi:hypothetical protein